MRVRIRELLEWLCRIACACGLTVSLFAVGQTQEAPITSYEQMRACVDGKPGVPPDVAFRQCADHVAAPNGPVVMGCLKQSSPWACVAAVLPTAPPSSPPSTTDTQAPITSYAGMRACVAGKSGTDPDVAFRECADHVRAPDGPVILGCLARTDRWACVAGVYPTPPPSTTPSPTPTPTPTASPTPTPTPTPTATPTPTPKPTPLPATPSPIPTPPSGGTVPDWLAVIIAVASGLIGLILGFILKRPKPIPFVLKRPKQILDPADDTGAQSGTVLDHQEHSTSPSLRIDEPRDHSIAIAGQPVLFHASTNPPNLAATIRWSVETQPAMPCGIGPSCKAQFDDTGVQQVVARLDQQGLARDVIVYVFKTPEGGSAMADLLRSARPPVVRDVTSLHRYGPSAGGPPA